MKFIANILDQPHLRRYMAFLALLSAAGCAVTAPWHDTARHIQSAASLATAIQFHTNALPDEAPSAPDRLTLAVAVECALRQSPELQIALANVRAAQADAHESRLLPNPVLDIAFRFPEGGGRTIIEAGLATQLAQLLQRPRRISAADAALRAASARAITVTLRVMHATQREYFETVALRDQSSILAQRVSRINELLRVAEARLAAGEGTQLDVATFKAELATSNLDLRETSRAIKNAQIALAQRLGQPRGRIDWDLATPLYTQVALRGEPDAIAHGLRVRPEIQADRWQLAALEDEKALARLAWLESAAGGLDTERNDGWSLGPSLAMPLPIFDWGQAKRAGARAQAIAARQRLTQTTRQVVSEIRSAHHAIAELITTTDQARTNLIPLHQERVRLAKAVFDAGQEDITRLRLAELDLLEAQLKLAHLEYRTTRAIIDFDRATGGSTEGSSDDE